MNDAANTAGSGNASAPATTKAAPKNPWALPDVSYLMMGVLGGTGDQGRGLAYGAIVNVSSIEVLRDRWRLYALTPAAGWGWC